MMHQVVQGPRTRQPPQSSKSSSDRLVAWLHDAGSPWNSEQSSETQGAPHAHGPASIEHPDSPLLSGSTTTSYCTSNGSTRRVPVPPPLGLSDPASLTAKTRNSTALLVGTGTWFANLSSRPRKSPEAYSPEPAPQLQPERRLNASFREILFNNPDYAERLIRTVQDIHSEDRNILFNPSFNTLTSLGGGDSTIRHHADSGQASGAVTPATNKPTPSSGASNKRKTPPGGNRQDPGKRPDDSSGGGSAGGHHQNKKSKTSDFLYLCPFYRVYHIMSPQHKFKSCQPPGHIKTRSGLKRHLKEVHVRTRASPNSQAGSPGMASNHNPDYSMDEDLWNRVVGIFDSAQSKRYTRGSGDWMRNEGSFYQEIWKLIFPNQPMPTSPFYEDSVDGHPLIDTARHMLESVFKEKANRAFKNGQVVSAEGYRPSQEEAKDIIAVTIATLLNTSTELSQRANNLPLVQPNSDHLHPLTEDTRSTTTPATSIHDHVPDTIQGPPTSTITAPQLAGIADDISITDTDADQYLDIISRMAGDTQPELPAGTLQGQLFDTPTTVPQATITSPKAQMMIFFPVETPIFEIILKGKIGDGYFGPQNWAIPVPAGLVVEQYYQRQMEPPVDYGQPVISGNPHPGVSSSNSQLNGTGNDYFISGGGYCDPAANTPNLSQ